MAVRSLTDVFILMRNNAIQSKNVLSAHHAEEDDDTIALVGKKHSKELKASYVKTTFFVELSNLSNNIRYETSKIEEKIEELAVRHERHLTRPTLDDTFDEEQAIEVFTEEITHLFHKCNETIKTLGKYRYRCNDQEKQMLKNAISSYAADLQQLSLDFRKQQGQYLKKLKARDERSHQFFTSSNTAIMVEEDDISDDFFEKGYSGNQLSVAVKQNTMNIEKREEEIRSVVQSITDLSEIFKDISQIVVEQGTMLDRIDYNIEQAVVKTEAGLHQLEKAQTYQKKNRKMVFIFVLAIIATILFIVLLVTKT